MMGNGTIENEAAAAVSVSVCVFVCVKLCVTSKVILELEKYMRSAGEILIHALCIFPMFFKVYVLNVHIQSSPVLYIPVC